MLSRAQRHYGIGIAGQLATFVLLGVALMNSTVSGRRLLVIAAIWFFATLAWLKVEPSSFFFNLGKRNRAKITFVYAFGWLYQLFVFGWVLPLGVGIYRITLSLPHGQ